MDRASGIGFVIAAATALLDAGDGPLGQQGHLAACTPAATAALRAAVWLAADVAHADVAGAAQEGSAVPLTLLRPGGASLPILVVPVAPPPLHAGAAAGPPVLAPVQAMNPRYAETGPSAALLGALLGLTPAEAELALRTARSKGLRAIAAALGITHSTARSHLQRVFQKTRVRRQAELVWLVAHLCRAGRAARPG